MKRVAVVGLIVLAVVGGFLVSPFLGLAHIRDAVEARNAAMLSDRIDFNRLRSSLGAQIVSAYMHLTGKDQQYGRFGLAVATGLGASMADPLLADIVNPDAMLDFLSGKGISKVSVIIPSGPNLLARANVGSLWQAFANSEYGLGNFYITVPTGAAPTDRYGLRLQVLQWDWKLTGIELPERVRMELARELLRRVG